MCRSIKVSAEGWAERDGGGVGRRGRCNLSARISGCGSRPRPIKLRLDRGVARWRRLAGGFWNAGAEVSKLAGCLTRQLAYNKRSGAYHMEFLATSLLELITQDIHQPSSPMCARRCRLRPTRRRRDASPRRRSTSSSPMSIWRWKTRDPSARTRACRRSCAPRR